MEKLHFACLGAAPPWFQKLHFHDANLIEIPVQSAGE
jgi:hypothetical protein